METKNIKFVAFLRYKGLFPIHVEKLHRGKAQYRYDMSEKEWMELKQAYDKSEFIKYAQCLDAVVDLAY